MGLGVTADDGAVLATDCYRPTGAGPWPAVLIRTYLGKAQHTAEAVGWARRGFACAVQDVRGRYDSGGEWRPYATERRDGRAAVEWLVRQPWSNGEVAAAGGSYGAFTAWSAALAHPAVRAVISAVPAMRPMPLQPEDGGVLPLLSRVSWWTNHAGARCARHGLAETMLEHAPEALGDLPVVDLPSRLWAPLPGWRDAVLETEASADSTGRPPIPDAELASLDVAALHIGGWHDPFCAETLRHVELAGRDVSPRPPRALVLGPWWHRISAGQPARYGERHYGDDSRFALGRFQARWLRRALAGEAPEDVRRVFLCGRNRWIGEGDETPAPDDGAASTTLFLDAGGLTSEAPRGPGDATFTYDARDPRPCRRTPIDEGAQPARGDVSAFEGAPLPRPLRILGAPRLVLWGRVEAPSADWVARLLEVTADGRRLYLAHGLVDAARALAARGERFIAGQEHRVEIRLSPVGISLPAGSRLRLEVTGCAFPSYARNLASGEPRLTGTRLGTARQIVCWGPGRVSALELPASDVISKAGHAARR
ncbi:MAG: CocE/NonD family hydrolase, partial [Acidobacteriota bacterium]